MFLLDLPNNTEVSFIIGKKVTEILQHYGFRVGQTINTFLDNSEGTNIIEQRKLRTNVRYDRCELLFLTDRYLDRSEFLVQ